MSPGNLDPGDAERVAEQLLRHRPLSPGLQSPAAPGMRRRSSSDPGRPRRPLRTRSVLSCGTCDGIFILRSTNQARTAGTESKTIAMVKTLTQPILGSVNLAANGVHAVGTTVRTIPYVTRNPWAHRRRARHLAGEPGLLDGAHQKATRGRGSGRGEGERTGGKPQVLEDGPDGGGAEDDGADSAGATARGQWRTSMPNEAVRQGWGRCCRSSIGRWANQT